MRIDILTLFPEAVSAMLSSSILGRAAKKGIIEINCVQIRDFSDNKQQQVDDYPYGGGWGCVMMAQPLKSCLDWVTGQTGSLRRRVIYMSPQGIRFDQSQARRLAAGYDHLVLVCGHYEGVDERFISLCCDEEMSVGDYVLTGGEIPAMAVTDAVCRLIPGVLSDPACYMGESHWDGLLEYPQYTRPDVWEGLTVPEVLRAGDHHQVDLWRREQQLLRTRERRPDMFAAFQPASEEDKELLRRLTEPVTLRYDCRRGEEEDLDVLLAIGAEASAFLQLQGIDPRQDGFLEADVFRRDTTAGNCWLFTFEGEVVGCVSLFFVPEADYENLVGVWLTAGESYGVIRRLAVRDAWKGRGLAGEMMQLGEDLCRGMGLASVRTDIHPDNLPMRRLLEGRGYLLRGNLLLTGSTEGEAFLRVGYEKIL